MPKEAEVEEIVRQHLKEQGFTVFERTGKHGVDIQAHKDGRSYYVEVEGDTKPNGNPFTASQKYAHLLKAIGQICLRMNSDPEGVFCLALPEDDYYKEKIEELQLPLRKLGVHVYSVELKKKLHPCRLQISRYHVSV